MELFLKKTDYLFSLINEAYEKITIATAENIFSVTNDSETLSTSEPETKSETKSETKPMLSIEIPLEYLENPENPENKTLNKKFVKSFLAKTLIHASVFSSKSSKLFNSSNFFVYENLKNVWKKLTSGQKDNIWFILHQMFVISAGIYPVIHKTDYHYVKTVIELGELQDKNSENGEKNILNIELPKLSLIQRVCGLGRGCISQFRQEIEDGKLSKNIIEKHLALLQTAKSLQDVQTMFAEISAGEDAKYVKVIVEQYFTESRVLQFVEEFTTIFSSDSFQTVFNKYDRHKIIQLIQQKQLNFTLVRQLMYDSGLIELFGDDFEFPTSIENCMSLVSTYSGKEISTETLSSLLNKEQIGKLIESKEVKGFLKKSGMESMIAPFLSKFFNKKDYQVDKMKRKLKRRKDLEKSVKNNAQNNAQNKDNKDNKENNNEDDLKSDDDDAHEILTDIAELTKEIFNEDLLSEGIFNKLE
jgi:hypothetical protein